MQSELPFYEGPEDALRAAVQALGGAKKVGALLWPERTADAAGRLLLDCLNPARSEKLEMGQLLYILRQARESGVHAPMQWFAAECGYDAKPITRAEEADRAALAVESASRVLSGALAMLERVQRANNVRAA
jgi:hypothetical protein